MIDAAAMVGLAGMDAERFLRSRDPLEVAVTARVAARVAARTLELRTRQDENLAVMIANAVGKVFGGG